MACITLLSDFGLQDASVAVAKGILMQYTPSLSLIDISHEVAPFCTRQAAYLLAAAYNNFPPGTIHIALFDLFSNKPARLVLSEHRGHFFLSPDNGLIPATLGLIPGSNWLAYELTAEQTFSDWLAAAGKIVLQLQTKSPAGLSLLSYEPKATGTLTRDTTSTTLNCEVIHIDRYENVVLDITRQQFTDFCAGRNFSLQLMSLEEITEISVNYSDVRPGNKLCRFNSHNYLEICINRGKAASLFGFRLNSKHNEIKLIIE